MGNQTSQIPSVSKLREIILLKLHHALIDRDDVIEKNLLEAFSTYDETRRGFCTRDEFIQVSQELQVDVGSKIGLAMDLFEFDDGALVDYVSFVSFLRPPGHIGWQVEKQIESCSVYEVFQGVRKRDKALITVKEVQIEDIAQNQRVVSIRKEIEALKVVQHANILRYLGTSVEGDKLQVMQEWAETCSLKTTLSAFGPMNERTIRRYLGQILSGLAQLHNDGISHGFLNGETIYIDHCGLLKLGEFGVGWDIVHLANGNSEPDDEDIYACYPAPEIEFPNIPTRNRKVDIWNVGLVTLQMMSGSESLANASRSPLKASIISHNIPPIPKSTSPQLLSFLKQCFNKNPRTRLDANALQLHEFLQEDPSDDTNRMLSDVCSSLDVTMKRLQEQIPKPSRRDRVERERPSSGRRTTKTGRLKF